MSFNDVKRIFSCHRHILRLLVWEVQELDAMYLFPIKMAWRVVFFCSLHAEMKVFMLK